MTPGWLVAAVAALGAAAAPPRAVFHTRLVAAEPAQDDTIPESPARIRLTFSEPVSPALARIALVARAGEPLLLIVRGDSLNPQVLLATPPTLLPGAYRVAWRVVSADGHPVSGDYAFWVAGDEALGPTPPAHNVPFETAVKGDSTGPPTLQAALRGLAMAVLLAAAGVWSARAGIAPAEAAPPRSVALILGGIAPLLLAAHGLAWMAYATGAPITLDAVAATAREGPGRGEALRVGLAVLAIWAAGLARRERLAAVFALAAVVVSGGIGHPAAIRSAVNVPANAVHLLAAALWLGALLTIVLGDLRSPGYRTAVHRASGVALGAVVAIAITGMLQALLLVPHPRTLLGSPYGALVFAKAGGLTILVLFGARHRFRLLPRLADGASPAPLRRSVRLETAVMVAIVLVAAFLAYVPPPSTTIEP